MKITHEAYYSNENKFLSNSKINDFFRSPEYFYKKHVTGELKSLPTDAMIIGRAVDVWLTDSKAAFDAQFMVVTRRNLKNPPTTVTELNNSQYDLICRLATAVEPTTAYKSLKGHTAQKILFKDMRIGEYFSGLCGIPDWFKVDGTHCIITDLKTTQDADPSKYKWKLKELGYYRQAAIYQQLVKHNYPEVTTFAFRHLVVEKDSDDINNVYAYALDQKRIADAWTEVEGVISDLQERTSFKKKDADFDDIYIIDQYVEQDF